MDKDAVVQSEETENSEGLVGLLLHEKPEKPAKHERSGRPVKHERSERPAKHERAEKHKRFERHEKPEMPERPLIGITCPWEAETSRAFMPAAYIRAVEEGGGLPLLIPPLQEELWPSLIKACHGFLLAGGGDVSSLLWGEEPLPGQGEAYPPRDVMELFLARVALARDIPILGICRGIQVMALAAGGSIYQDIYTQREKSLQHTQQAPRSFPHHTVTLEKGTLLARITGEHSLRVNSIHHQAVKTIPPGFRPSAYAADGIIEAMELTGNSYAIGVQWHPECLGDAPSKRLFRSFIQAYRQVKSNKGAAGVDNRFNNSGL